MLDAYSKNTAKLPRAGKLSAMITTAIKLSKKGSFKNFTTQIFLRKNRL